MSEALAYLPPQELNSKSLQLGVDINGFHETLPVAESQKSTPFAFNLGHEFRLAKEHGTNYQQYFIENAHYYAKESYGRVPVSEYEHKIMEDEDGRVRLALGPSNESARDSYLVPAEDKSKPEWYRRRSMGDVRWIDSMQESLRGAEVGDTFLDLSPTEFNVSIQVRKTWGFADHSFARLHKVVVENGQKKLVSKAIRDYLDEDEHSVLFEQLTGEKVETKDMLGRVEKVNPDITPAYVKALAERLHPSSDHKEKTKSETEMDNALFKIDTWLISVYEMMQRGESPSEIVKQFRGWENAVKDYVEGKNDLKQFENVTLDCMRVAVQSGMSLVSSFTNRIYEPGANGCGLGSGFGEEKREEAMTYESMTKATEGDCPEIKCGNKEKKCSWKANESEVNEITAGKLTKCPKCGWKP